MSFKMKKTIKRKLFLFGRYSLALLPPKKWLSKLGIKEGDYVDMELNTSKRRLIIQFRSSELDSPDTKTTKSPTDTDKSKNGWEPIPRI